MIRTAGDRCQSEPLGSATRRRAPEKGQQPQCVRRTEVPPVHVFLAEKREQVLQVVRVGPQGVRREAPVCQVSQEPAGRPHRLILVIDELYSANDPVPMLLKYPHHSLPARHSDGSTRAAGSPFGATLTQRCPDKDILGRYLFNIKASGPGQGLRPFRDPDAEEDEAEDG